MMASTKGGGQYATTGPTDVCKTPSPAGPVPLPYPNLAMCASASGAVSKVKISKKETLVQGSKVPTSNGDNAGVAGGIKSNVFMQAVEPKVFSGKVYAKGKKVTFAFATSAHNGSNSNIVGLQVAPSQTKVWVSS
ncbi:MAG: type VI secretion protein [Deltaproteobacteria bacterium]|nr:MAG: type VI secretion protein [Deltaproteobacteria bacterium]